MNILKANRDYKMKQKTFFITFNELSAGKHFLRTDSAPLNDDIFTKLLERERNDNKEI